MPPGQRPGASPCVRCAGTPPDNEKGTPVLKRIMIIVAALALLFVAVAPASAADNVPTSGSCKLSANWTVLVSANWDGTSTSGGVTYGTLDYVVVNSPGVVHGGVEVYRAAGYSSADISYNDNVATGGRYIERINPGLSHAYEADVIAVAPSGIACTATMHL